MTGIKKRRLIYAATAAIVLFSAAFAYYYIKRTGPYYLPDIVLETYDRQPFALSSLSGKPALVVFWASTCAICKKELPQLVALYNDYADKGLEVVGVVIYYNNKNEAYIMAQEQQIPYRIVLDEDKQATFAFNNVHLTPTTFLIAPNGRIVYRKTGEIDFNIIREKIQQWLTNE